MMVFNPLFFNITGKDSESLSLKSLKSNSVNFLFADIIKVYAGEGSELSTAEITTSAKQTNSLQSQSTTTQRGTGLLNSNVLALLTLPGIKEMVKQNISAKYNTEVASANTTLSFDGMITGETGESLLSALIESLSPKASAQNLIRVQNNPNETINVEDIKAAITEMLKSGKPVILKLVDNKVTMEFNLKQVSKLADTNNTGYDIKITVSENKKSDSEKKESMDLSVETSDDNIKMNTQNTIDVSGSDKKNEKLEVTANKTELNVKPEEINKEVIPGKVIQAQANTSQVQAGNSNVNPEAVTLVFNISEKDSASISGWNKSTGSEDNPKKEIKVSTKKTATSKNVLPADSKVNSDLEKEIKLTADTKPEKKSILTKNDNQSSGTININSDKGKKVVENKTAEGSINTKKQEAQVNVKSVTDNQLKNKTDEKTIAEKIKSSEVNVNNLKDAKKEKSGIPSLSSFKPNTLKNNFSNETSETSKSFEKTSLPTGSIENKTADIKTLFAQTKDVLSKPGTIINSKTTIPDSKVINPGEELTKGTNNTTKVDGKTIVTGNSSDNKTTDIKTPSAQIKDGNYKPGTTINSKTIVVDSNTINPEDELSKETNNTTKVSEKTIVTDNSSDNKTADIKTVSAPIKDGDSKPETFTNIKTTIVGSKASIVSEKYSKEVNNVNKTTEKNVIPGNPDVKTKADLNTGFLQPEEIKAEPTASPKVNMANIKTAGSETNAVFANSKTTGAPENLFSDSYSKDLIKESGKPETESPKVKITGNEFKSKAASELNEVKKSVNQLKIDSEKVKGQANNQNTISDEVVDYGVKKSSLSEKEPNNVRNNIADPNVNVKNQKVSGTSKEKTNQPVIDSLSDKEKIRNSFSAEKTLEENKNITLQQKPVKENIPFMKEKYISSTDVNKNLQPEIINNEIDKVETTSPELSQAGRKVSENESILNEKKNELLHSTANKEKEIIIKTNAKKIHVLDVKQEIKTKQQSIIDNSSEKNFVNHNEEEKISADTKLKQATVKEKILFAEDSGNDKKPEMLNVKTTAGLANTDTNFHQENIKEVTTSSDSGKTGFSTTKDDYGNESENSAGNKKQSGEHNVFAKEMSSIKSTAPEPAVSYDVTKNVKYTEVVKEISKFILKKEKSSVTLNLEPESFGKVKVRLDIVENNAKVVVEVENEVVKKMIENNVSQLFQSLNQNGLALSSLQVSTSGSESKQTKNQSGNKKKFNLENEATANIEDKTKIKSFGYNTYEFLA
ncbi:MAG: hypothetical protein C4539_13020 [Ignavibacteriales bacterium]|nr:MAG: hypothetical protein C4539_13020 [Ignavibacteriales bacterium]